MTEHAARAGRQLVGAGSTRSDRPALAPLPRLAKLAIALELALAIGALAGGLALMIGPRGEIIPLPLSLLEGSPFTSYFGPGAILFTVLGAGPLAAAVLAWRRHRSAPVLALATGGALIVWIVVEIAIIGYSNRPPLQALYLGLGVVISSIALAWLRETSRA